MMFGFDLYGDCGGKEEHNNYSESVEQSEAGLAMVSVRSQDMAASLARLFISLDQQDKANEILTNEKRIREKYIYKVGKDVNKVRQINDAVDNLTHTINMILENDIYEGDQEEVNRIKMLLEN